MRKKCNKSSRKKSVAVAGAVALFIILTAGFFIVRYMFDNFMPNVDKESVLYIYPDSPYDKVINDINKCVINYNSFNRSAERNGLRYSFKPGRYVLKQGTSNRHIIRSIINGYETPIMLTLSGNIRNLSRLSSILGKKLAYDSLDFISYFNNDTVWAKYNLSRETFQSLFLPETYEVYWTVSPKGFVERMKKEYDKFWNSDRLNKANALQMSKEEVSTLASIICEESNYKKEYPTIAGVYINRLHRGIKLDADPTVKFALNDPSVKRILYSHLKIDSPYNTYLYAGLPPGPITIPSIAAIDAVLNYEKHSYLYFCADPSFNGMHRFAKTLSEHNANAKAYQNALNKLQ